MLSKSSTIHKIKVMAKGKPFDFDKTFLHSAYKDNQYKMAIGVLDKIKAKGNLAHDYYLITEITTQVLVE